MTASVTPGQLGEPQGHVHAHKRLLGGTFLGCFPCGGVEISGSCCTGCLCTQARRERTGRSTTALRHRRSRAARPRAWLPPAYGSVTPPGGPPSASRLGGCPYGGECAGPSFVPCVPASAMQTRSSPCMQTRSSPCTDRPARRQEGEAEGAACVTPLCPLGGAGGAVRCWLPRHAQAIL